MQPTQPKYTAEQWTASLPALRGMSTTTLDIARAVLVEGKEPIEVANNIGQSRQLVHAAIKRVTAVLERQTVGLVPVMVWLTPEDVAHYAGEFRRVHGIHRQTNQPAVIRTVFPRPPQGSAAGTRLAGDGAVVAEDEVGVHEATVKAALDRL